MDGCNASYPVDLTIVAMDPPEDLLPFIRRCADRLELTPPERCDVRVRPQIAAGGMPAGFQVEVRAVASGRALLVRHGHTDLYIAVQDALSEMGRAVARVRGCS